MSELTLVAKAKAKPGRETELERELRQCATFSREEKGCLRYLLHRSIEDPATFIVIERWASKEDLDKHFITLHAQTLLEKVPSLVAAPPEIMTCELLSEDRADKSCF